MRTMRLFSSGLTSAFAMGVCATASAQLTDLVNAPNPIDAGIRKGLADQIGAGVGDVLTPDSSTFIIARDPFRSIRRGRQLFQRKFRVAEGQGARTGDGVGDISLDGSIGAGLGDSCATCHARPFGSAGFGGDVFTRPKSRDAPHLFGLGLQEMLADEITAELRLIRDTALQQAATSGGSVVANLVSKGIDYGSITAFPNGAVDTSAVEGVNPDLRVRPFFAEGTTISIREFLVGAFNAEMGLESFDPLLEAASTGSDVETPAGMRLTGSVDAIEAPPVHSSVEDSDFDGVVNEIDASLVDHMEFYLLNYFRPGLDEQTNRVRKGRQDFLAIGCGECHIPDLPIRRDRRVADVETRFDLANSNVVYNRLFATAKPLHGSVDDLSGFPPLKPPIREVFLVESIFTDLKRHDLGVAFHELNFDGTIQTEFMTEPLWGVGSTPPYGHDGRSNSLTEVILRHGGEAAASTQAFSALTANRKRRVLEFLRSLVLFSPEDTPSNLNPTDGGHPDFPFAGQGSISLTPLFNDPGDIE